MPRKAMTTEPEAKPVEAAPEVAPVSKTAGDQGRFERQSQEHAEGNLRDAPGAGPGCLAGLRVHDQDQHEGQEKEGEESRCRPCAGSRSRAAQGRRVGRPAGQGEEAGPGTRRRQGSQDGPECLGAAAGLSWHGRDDTRQGCDVAGMTRMILRMPAGFLFTARRQRFWSSCNSRRYETGKTPLKRHCAHG